MLALLQKHKVHTLEYIEVVSITLSWMLGKQIVKMRNKFK